MKYFTKEWYAKCQRAHLDGALKVSSRAERFSEKYYQSLLRKELQSFLKDLQDDSSILDEHEEKKRTEQFMAFHKKMLEDLGHMLPDDLLDKVADLRVLALAVADKNVKEAVTLWCQDLRMQLDALADEYSRLAESQKSVVGEEIQKSFAFHDAIISAIEQEDKYLLLKLEQNCYSNVMEVTFENPCILEQEGDLRGAWWLYQELYPAENGNVYHMLLQRKDDQLAYLTLTATGISFVMQSLEHPDAQL